MANESKTYDLKVEKTIRKPVAEVFKALGEGRLFLNCSADEELLKIDFRVGGKYSIDFLEHKMKNTGEFLEIIPNRKIVFTWCQDYETSPIPDTKVDIELKSLGEGTSITLIHTGFHDEENRNGHEGGWGGGLSDLGAEIVDGTLRFNRKISIAMEKLFDLLKGPAFAERGTVLESTPNEKIVMSWNHSIKSDSPLEKTRVTFLLEATEDKNGTWLQIIHEGLTFESERKAQRREWEAFYKKSH